VLTDLYIDGRAVPASDAGRFPVHDPATGDVLGTVADGTVADALSAVEAAHRAAAGWAARPPRERGEVLRRAFELMTERAEDLARLISAENGKALVDARGEVAYAAEFFRWYGEEAVRALGVLATAPSGANRILVQHQPVGVCVLVTPWNFPAAMATRKIGPALAAGCTVVLKPASDTPLTALAVAELLADAGVPPGVVNVLPARRSGAVVSAMLHDDRVRKLSFTGSTEVGRVLLHEAADRVVNCSMELGGNAPFLVFADADLDAAVDGAMIAKMRNAGEACTAANRFYVEAPVAEEFSRRLAARMAALVVGPGTKTGMAIRYDNPREIGADRLVNAVAIRDRFDGAAVCVDFGTATTFDVVSHDGEYLGGALMTGIEISLDALSERGARLPKVDLAPPKSVIGKNTIDAIRSGVVFGYAGAIDAIMRRLYDELGERAQAIATGGLAGLVVPYTEELDEVDDLLTLTGLRLLHEKNS